jgi:hypothetical protein
MFQERQVSVTDQRRIYLEIYANAGRLNFRISGEI